MTKIAHVEAPKAKISPLRKSLKLKLVIVLITVALAPLILWNIVSFDLVALGAILPLALLIAFVGILLIWEFLKPIDKLYQREEILLKDDNNCHTLEKKDQDKDEYKQNISQPDNSPSINTNTLSSIASSIKDGVVVLNSDYKIIYTNRPAADILGYPSSSMQNKSLEDLAEIKDINDKAVVLKDYFKQGTLTNPSLVHIQSRNGQVDPLEVVLSRVTDETQPNLGSILVLHDTAQEKALQQMQIDFVSMASHEFRTPLTSIINYLAVLTEEAKDKLAVEQRQFLDRALSSAKEMSALVDNILNVSKIERGSMALSLKEIDWKKKITRIVEEIQTQAAYKHISMKLNLPASIPTLLVDEVRITEVLNNIINNAITYTQESGKIEIGVKVEKEEVTTYIADNGSGIPKEALPKLFNKFYRAPGSLEKNSQGSGLGLYISKSIVDLHHGKIWVESEVEKGSTFYFSLPTAEASKKTPTIVDLEKGAKPTAA